MAEITNPANQRLFGVFLGGAADFYRELATEEETSAINDEAIDTMTRLGYDHETGTEFKGAAILTCLELIAYLDPEAAEEINLALAARDTLNG